MRRIARLNGIVHVICTGDELTVQQASDKIQGEPEIYPLLFYGQLEMVGVSIKTPESFNDTRGEKYENLEGWRFLDWDAPKPEPHNDLRARFAATGKRPRHFIAWAAEMGFKVEHATISRHEAGTQGITIPWGIAYECFFNECEKNI